MTEITAHTPGTPGWIDIGTDVAGAKAFYCGLFGWDTQDAGPPEQTGGYGFFTKGGKMVAGYGPQQNPGPPFWSVYIIVTDADAVTKKAEAAGATVVMAPMDVMSAGRMAIFQDPQGAFISLWQPGEHTGAQLVSEPGALAWSELQARDLQAATGFYTDVFGWAAETHQEPMAYTEWHLGGHTIAGMMTMAPMVPAEVPSHWLAYFGVEDVDATLPKLEKLGGSVRMPPMDFPGGRFAVVADPQGATFGLLRMNG